MPALPSVPKVLKVAWKFTMSENTNAAIRYFLNFTGGNPTNAQLATFAGAIAASALTHIIPLMGIGVTQTEVEAMDLTSPTAAVGTWTGSQVGTRGDTEDLLPADICLLESQEIQRRYRGGHPRIYWPFGTSADMNDFETWDSTFLTACATGLAALHADEAAAIWSGGGSLGPCNVSFYEGFTVHTGTTGRARNVSTPRITPIVDVVTSSIVRPGIATQRKRLLRLA